MLTVTHSAHLWSFIHSRQSIRGNGTNRSSVRRLKSKTARCGSNCTGRLEASWCTVPAIIINSYGKQSSRSSPTLAICILAPSSGHPTMPPVYQEQHTQQYPSQFSGCRRPIASLASVSEGALLNHSQSYPPASTYSLPTMSAIDQVPNAVPSFASVPEDRPLVQSQSYPPASASSRHYQLPNEQHHTVQGPRTLVHAHQSNAASNDVSSIIARARHIIEELERAVPPSSSNPAAPHAHERPYPTAPPPPSQTPVVAARLEHWAEHDTRIFLADYHAGWARYALENASSQ